MLPFDFLSQPIHTVVTKEVEDRLQPIFERACCNPNDPRNAKQKWFTGLQGLMAEEALTLKGFSLNPFQFDFKNKESYNWDVEKDDIRFEVKKLNKKPNDTFCHFNRNAFQRFMDHPNDVKYLIGVTVFINADHQVEVRVMFVIEPSEFFKWCRESQFKDHYGEQNMYFNHLKVDRSKCWLNSKYLKLK